MKEYFHNLEFFVEEEQGVSYSRVPKAVVEKLTKQGAPYSPSGTEIRFVIEGEKATISFYYDGADGEDIYAPQLYLYYGSFQAGWRWLDPYTVQQGLNKVVIEKPKNMDELLARAKKFDTVFSPEIIRVSGFNKKTYFLGVEGARPVKEEEKPNKLAVFYGSSITHGSLSQNINACYAALTARALNVDYLNKGLAGSCYLENEMIDYIFSIPATFYNIEVGTNCFWQDSIEWFKERIDYLLSAYTKLGNDKPLFIIDEFKFNDLHKVCTEIVKSRIEKLGSSNVYFIDGQHLLETEDNLSADFVHPKLDGHFTIANNLSKFIKSKIKV